MNGYSKIALILSIALAFIGCTKDEITPNPPSNDPVFSVSGTIDGHSIDLEAGENNSYMHTGIVNLNGVDYYRGALARETDKVQISVADGILDIPEVNTDIMSAGEIMIAPNHGGDALAVLSEDLFSNKQYIEEITWTVDGVAQSDETVYITKPGKYEICADVIFTGGSTASTCNTMLIGYQKNVNPVLKYIIGQSDQVIGFIDSPNNEIETIKWYRNDVLVTEGLTYNDSLTGLISFALKARIEYANGSIREREIWVNRTNPYFKIEDLSNIENQSNLIWDNKAIIEVDINGDKYVSDPSLSSHKITIDNSWEYGTNSDGDKVTFIEGSLNSTFRNQVTGEIVEGSFNIRFGLAH